MNQNNIEENEIYSEEQWSTKIFGPVRANLVNHDTEEQVGNIFDRRQVAIRAVTVIGLPK